MPVQSSVFRSFSCEREWRHTAAAVASFNEREQELKRAGLYFADTTYKAMMVDMGAGTTDIVLFEYRIENGKLHINNPVTYPTAESTRLCGGREIDDILSEFCIGYKSYRYHNKNP